MNEKRRELVYVDPLRNPRHAPIGMRNWRGWLLLICSALLPGSVQSIIGDRRKARIPLLISLFSWALIVLLIVVALVSQRAVLSFASSALGLIVLMVWLAVAGLNWVLCMLDSVRRIRIDSLGRRTKPTFLAVSLVLVLLVGGGVAWGVNTLNSTRSALGGIFASGPGKKPVDGRYNIALLGSDAGKKRTGVRPDSLSVVSIEVKSGRAVVIGLPRNMQNVPFPDSSPLHAHYPQGYNCGDECLINAVYQEGEEHKDEFPNTDKVPAGVQATEQALSGVTGLDIQYYAMIDLKGFQKLVDAMGGIRLDSNVRVPISNKTNKATGKHYKPLGWIEPGKNIELDGYHALWYARSREFASDYARMTRQRCVQEAMLKQLDPMTVAQRFTKLAAAAPEVISTDIPQNEVGEFVDLATKAKGHKMAKLNLAPPKVVPKHPDFATVHDMVSTAVEKASDKGAQAQGNADALGLDSVQAMSARASGAESGGGEDPDSDGSEICSVP
ncbi:LCP family protein [Brevibacterium sp. 91QC2O2]|uniref:LCP family glycopolymer transferase n=1 Tax=Brevibacterium TaxID=1696 RepID=UPI00211CD68C|nr:LCP family protein [Brevibacterium sp. 91QC2O2]MCQ9385942.1 LCP family protein [Brevibacterium sp. 68QC2CO]